MAAVRSLIVNGRRWTVCSLNARTAGLGPEAVDGQWLLLGCGNEASVLKSWIEDVNQVFSPMHATSLSVRELDESDVDLIANYWSQADPDYLTGLGVDLSKLPSRDDFAKMLTDQLKLPLELRQSYCTIWQEGQQAIGHCNVNKLVFGQEAFMHLHLWRPELRHQGLGMPLVRQSLKLFFGRLELQNLICEPYALNPAPNGVLAKVGFDFVKQYMTVPGTINFEQKVNRWHMSRVRFASLGT